MIVDVWRDAETRELRQGVLTKVEVADSRVRPVPLTNAPRAHSRAPTSSLRRSRPLQADIGRA